MDKTKKKSGIKKVISVIVDIILVIYLIFALVVAAMAVSSSKTGVPNAFGYTLNSIQTSSMEPTFNAGDLIVTKKIDDKMSLEKGDVISFWCNIVDANGNEFRIIEVHRIDNIEMIDGKKVITTKGDNNPIADINAMTIPDNEEDIIGLWSKTGEKGIVIKNGGNAIDFIKSSDGILYCLVIPLGIFFLYALYSFVKALVEYKYSKKDTSGLTEEEKQKAIEEYIKNQKENDDKKSNE